jgi:hypothetical protein
MATTDRRTAMIVCKWCDQPTPAGARCVACDGDPEGPFPKASGIAAVRDRRLAARQAMLAARKRTGPARDETPSVPEGLPAGRFVPDERGHGAVADGETADERLRAALELAPQIVDPVDAGTTEPAGTVTASIDQTPVVAAPAGPVTWLTPGVDLGDPSTWPPMPGAVADSPDGPAGSNATAGSDATAGSNATAGSDATAGTEPGDDSARDTASPASLAALADVLAGQTGHPRAPTTAPMVAATPADTDRAALKAARRQAWAAPERGRPWTLPPDLDPDGAAPSAGISAGAAVGGAVTGRRRHRLLKVVVVVALLGGGAAVGATTVLKPGKSGPTTTIAVAPPAPAAAWISVHGLNFTAAFPVLPAQSATAVQHVPDVTGAAQVWQADDSSGRYSVTEMSLAPSPGLDRAAVANALITGSAAAAKATVRAITPSEIGPYAVDDVTMTAAGSVVTERILISAQAAWLLSAASTSQPASGWLTFLRSFDPSV